MFRPLYHLQDFLWILPVTPGFQNATALDLSRQTTVLTVLSGFPPNLVLDFGWLGSACQIRRQTTGLSVLSLFNIWTIHNHWRRINSTLILFSSNLTVAWCCRSWWRRRAWGRCRTRTLLSWKCHWSWRIRTGGRTRWKAWNHDRNEVLRVALYPNPVLMRCVFWPLMQFDMHCGLIMHLHFSIGSFDCRRTTRFRQGIHLSISKVLFLLMWCASTLRSRQVIFVPEVWELIQAGTFSEAEKKIASSFSFNFSSWDRSSNFGALGLRWWGSPGQMYSSRGFWSRIWVTRNSLREFNTLDRTVHVWDPLKNRLRGFMSWKTQPKCRAFDNRRAVGPRLNSWWVSRLTSGLSGLPWLVTVDKGVTTCFRADLSSTWPLHFCHHYYHWYFFLWDFVFFFIHLHEKTQKRIRLCQFLNTSSYRDGNYNCLF